MNDDNDDLIGQDPEITILDDSPESGIEALRRQIEEVTKRAESAEEERNKERRARESEAQARNEAEQRANRYAEEARVTQRGANDAQYDSVINALAAAQSDLAAAKGEYQTALSEGDFAKAGDLSEAIGVAAVRVREFEHGKTVLERQRQAGTQNQDQQRQQDPRESYLQRMPTRTASWLRRNDRFFTDNTFQRAVQGADAQARMKGIEPESDQYFNFIEEQVGMREREQRADEPTSPTNPISPAGNTAPPRMPSAPAAGSTSTAAKSTPRAGEVRLTAEELDLCRTLDIKPAAYARQKIAAMASGEIGGSR